MAQCSPGDQVVCRIKDNAIVSAYEDKWQDECIFDIISLYEEGYMVYVPTDMSIKDYIYITKSNYKRFNADKRFIDSSAAYITDYKIIRIFKKLDGIRCMKCDNFYDMATANQPDGKLICWNCLHYPSWR